VHGQACPNHLTPAFPVPTLHACHASPLLWRALAAVLLCPLIFCIAQVLSDEQQRCEYNAKLEESLKDEEDDFNGEGSAFASEPVLSGSLHGRAPNYVSVCRFKSEELF